MQARTEEEFSDMLNKINIHRLDRTLLLICLIALLLRIVFVFSLGDTIYWNIDGKEYDLYARNILNGDGYVNAQGEPTAYRPVGYSLFLALIYLLCGQSIVAVRIIQVFLTVGLIVVIYFIVDKIFKRRAAHVAAAFCAVYPYFIYISGVLYPTAICTFLFVYLIYRLMIASEEPTIDRFVGVGLLYGTLLLIRPNFLALLPFFIAWYFLVPKVRQKVRWKNVSFAVLACALLVAPWVVRNYHAVGKYTLSTNGGRNFWLGNNVDATTATGNEVTIPPALQLELDKTASEIEKEKIYYRAGFEFVRDNFGQFVRLTAGKAVTFWRLYPLPSSGYKHNENLSKIASIISFTPILLLALLGLGITMKRQWRLNITFLCMFLAFNAAHAVFISIVRLRIPLDAFLIVFSSYAGVYVWDWFAGLSGKWKEHSRKALSPVDMVADMKDRTVEVKWPVISRMS